ncbi:glycosyltransferase family 1 protein [Nakamurella silvestris]|nr:glycosyltransferase family 1 protein [Nakamurella silvestris]
MRILVVNNFFPPRTGGSSHLSEALAKGYAAAGHEVLVVTAAYGSAPATEERDGLRIVRFPSFTIPESRFAVSFDISFTTRFGMYRRFRELVDGFAPDVVHQHGQFFDLTWAAGKYSRRRKVPALLSVHTRLENPAALYHGVFRFLDAVMVAPRLRRFTPRIVVMDALMDAYIKARYRRGYAALEYIPVAVDPGWTAGGNAAAGREFLGLAGTDPIILSLGHVIPLRDRLDLVRAMPAVLAANPSAKLVVVGRVYYDKFIELAAELGVSDAVISTGQVPKAQVPDLLAAAEVECHEQGFGMGTATLEAMAASVPVVAPGTADNFPGIELVHAGNIYLTPVGDSAAIAASINRVLADPAEAAVVAAAGRELIMEHFTMEAVVAEHLRVFGEMVG